MLRSSIITAMLFMIASTAVNAAPCRDAKGKFIKCPSTQQAATGAKPLPAGMTKDAKGKCHDAKGKFAKCPS